MITFKQIIRDAVFSVNWISTMDVLDFIKKVDALRQNFFHPFSGGFYDSVIDSRFCYLYGFENME